MPKGQGYLIQSVRTLDKGMIHTPGRMEKDSVGFHHVTQDGVQLKTYKLFVLELAM